MGVLRGRDGILALCADIASWRSSRHAATLPYASEGNELVRDPPPARVFTGILDVPALCIE
jgi:hypothetical protein